MEDAVTYSADSGEMGDEGDGPRESNEDSPDNEPSKKKRSGRTCKVCQSPLWQEGSRQQQQLHCSNRSCQKYKKKPEKESKRSASLAPNLAGSNTDKKQRRAMTCAVCKQNGRYDVKLHKSGRSWFCDYGGGELEPSQYCTKYKERET